MGGDEVSGSESRFYCCAGYGLQLRAPLPEAAGPVRARTSIGSVLFSGASAYLPGRKAGVVD